MAAAGTVVTEIATPISAPDFAEVSESVPATPARNATTNDIQSGCQMNPVLGRGLSIMSLLKRPKASISQAKPAVMIIARAKPPISAHSERTTRRGARCTRAVEIPASGPNSGPTAIAPTISTALSSITPQAASIVASARKET